MSKKEERLQVLVSTALGARVQLAADRLRMSKGAWVRRALEQALEEENSVTDPLTALASLEAPTGDIDRMLAEIEAGRRGGG